MAHKAPGKHYRKGLPLVEAVRQFSDEEDMERMFMEARWPNGVRCPRCESPNIQDRTGQPRTFRCRACRFDFTIKTDTVMQGSNLPLSKWVLCSYLMTTSLKGVSSMKLHRDLGVTQKTAWHMAHRIRRAWESGGGLFSGPVGKVAVAGIKDRETNQVAARPVPDTTSETLQGFMGERVAPGAKVYTDEHAAYRGLPNHEAVKHSVGEFVKGQAHVNGMESFWSMLKRGYVGTYHQMSAKHLDRYVSEFSGRHNDRPADTKEQIRRIIAGMVGKRLRYRDLVE